LLDLNVLIALTDDEHRHYQRANQWFDSLGREEWGICPLTEAGFIRLTTNPATGPMFSTFAKAIAVLKDLATQPGYRYWPIFDPWVAVTACFASRITGHQQITDAYLLGLAVKENGVLVTFDRGLKYLAGPEFRNNLLILE
jgi:hypothetical protein